MLTLLPKFPMQTMLKYLILTQFCPVGWTKVKLTKGLQNLITEKAFPISILILHSGTLISGIYAMNATTCPDIQRYLREPDIKLEVVPKWQKQRDERFNHKMQPMCNTHL